MFKNNSSKVEDVLKITLERQKELLTEISNLRSLNTVLTENAKRWAVRFSTSKIKEVTDSAAKMKAELERIEEQKMSEITKLKKEKTHLMELLSAEMKKNEGIVSEGVEGFELELVTELDSNFGDANNARLTDADKQRIIDEVEEMKNILDD